MTARKTLFRACALLLGLGLGMAVLEGAARVLAPGGAAGADPLRERHAAAARPAVVAIGDSQTWGINATADESWPGVLAARLGRPVRNMGVSGTGPVQYREAARRALALRPCALVVGVYLGNDLWDAYHAVYLEPRHASLRRPGAPADLLRDTLGPGSLARMSAIAAHRADGPLGAVGDWIARHSAAARMLRGAGAWPGASTRAAAAADRRWVRAAAGRGLVYDRAGVADVLIPAYRAAVVDLREPRMVEGARITRQMLAEIRGEAARAGSTPVFVFIPIKETVYARALRVAGEPVPPALARLERMEAEATAELARACTGAVCVHPLAALAGAVRRGEQLYPPYVEGHFNPRGYALLAAQVERVLR